MNRLNAQRTAFIAGIMICGTCRVVGQTPPMRDATVGQKPLAPLSATDPVVRDGLFSVDFNAFANRAGDQADQQKHENYANRDVKNLRQL